MSEKKVEDKELISSECKQLDITENNGKTTIVFRKAILKGKVTSSEVLNTILIAAKLQAEMYIKKLSKGTELSTFEIKALKELGDITKLEVLTENEPKRHEFVDIDAVKSNLHALLAEKLNKS